MWPIGHWADVGAQHLCSFAGEERCCCLAVSPARPDRPGSHHQRNFVLQTPGRGFLQRISTDPLQNPPASIATRLIPRYLLVKLVKSSEMADVRR
jgi:hypothetical protein